MADRLTFGKLCLDDITHITTLSSVSGVANETANLALDIHEPTSPLEMPTVKMDFVL